MFWDVCRLRNGFKFEDILWYFPCRSICSRALWGSQNAMWKINKNLISCVRRLIGMNFFVLTSLNCVTFIGWNKLYSEGDFYLHIYLRNYLKIMKREISSLCLFNLISSESHRLEVVNLSDLEWDRNLWYFLKFTISSNNLNSSTIVIKNLSSHAIN